MNIEAIEKAAEAALKSERRPVHVYREELEYDGAIDWRVQNQYGDEYASCGEYKSVAELIAALNPATVLELVRLARIGQRTLDRLDKKTERANLKLSESELRGGE